MPGRPAWKPAHRSATSASVKGAASRARWRTAVFRPANEKCGSARPCIGRGKVEAGRIAGQCRLLNRRAAGLRQAEQFGRLVEGFAQRIVDGGGDADVVADAAHQQHLRVAAGNEQQQVGRWQAVGQPDGERVGFEVVDGDERLAVASAMALAEIRPTIRPPIRPGPAVAAMPSIVGKRSRPLR